MLIMLAETLSGWGDGINLLHRFFADPFLHGFCGHLLLPATLVLLLAILFGGLGKTYGIPHLFWHEQRWKQFFVGVALFWLYANVVFVGYALETRPQAEAAPTAQQGSAEAADAAPQYRLRPDFTERVGLPASWDPLFSYVSGITLSIFYLGFLLLCAGACLVLSWLVLVPLLAFAAALVGWISGATGERTWPFDSATAAGVLLFVALLFLIFTQEALRPLLLLAALVLILVLLVVAGVGVVLVLVFNQDDPFLRIAGGDLLLLRIRRPVGLLVLATAFLVALLLVVPPPQALSLMPFVYAVSLTLFFLATWKTFHLVQSATTSLLGSTGSPRHPIGLPAGTWRLLGTLLLLLSALVLGWRRETLTGGQVLFTAALVLFLLAVRHLVLVCLAGEEGETKPAADLPSQPERPGEPAPEIEVGPGPLFRGLGVSFLVLTLLLLLFQTEEPVRTLCSRIAAAAYEALGLSGALGREPRDLHAYALIFASFALSAVVYLVVRLFQERFSPAVPFLFLLNGLVSLYGVMAYGVKTPLGSLALVLVLVLLGLLVLGSLTPFKVRFPGLERYYSQKPGLRELFRSVLGARQQEVLVPLSEYFKQRDEELSTAASTAHPFREVPRLRNGPQLQLHEPRTSPVAVVCVSGGGMRAAAWTTSVLAELEKAFLREEFRFPRHVLLFTGASGGMVGAALYTATLDDPQHPVSAPERQEILAQLVRNVEEDCLTPVVYELIYHDLRLALWPGAAAHDRGQALEAAWQRTLHGALDHTFEWLYPGEAAGWRPHLIFSPMLVEDGRQLLISNLDLRRVAENRGHLLGSSNGLLSREAVEFFDLFPEAFGTFRLSTAARMSASFPFVSPAGVLPTLPRRRVVDAGYYDNYGVSLAAAWLIAHREWLQDNTAGVVLIQIRDDVSEQQRTGRSRAESASSFLQRGLEWATTPATGLLSAWNASTSFRNDDQLALLSQLFDPNGDGLHPFFATVAFEFPETVSLSWYLTRREKQLLATAAAQFAAPREGDRTEAAIEGQGSLAGKTSDNTTKLRALLRWWRERRGLARERGR